MIVDQVSPRALLALGMLAIIFLAPCSHAMRYSGKFEVSAPATYITSFGFLPEGRANLSLHVTASKVNIALVGFSSTQELKFLMQSYRISCSHLANSTLESRVLLHLNSSTVSAQQAQNFHIHASERIHFYLLYCNTIVSTVEYSLSLFNMKSELSSDLYPLIPEASAVAALALTLVVSVILLSIYLRSLRDLASHLYVLLPTIFKFIMAVTTALLWQKASQQGELSQGLLLSYYLFSSIYRIFFAMSVVFGACRLEALALPPYRINKPLWIGLLISALLFITATFWRSNLALLSMIAYVSAMAAAIFILNARIVADSEARKAGHSSPSKAINRAQTSLFGFIVLLVIALAVLLVLTAVSAPSWTYVLIEDLFELSLLSLWFIIHLFGSYLPCFSGFPDHSSELST